MKKFIKEFSYKLFNNIQECINTKSKIIMIILSLITIVCIFNIVKPISEKRFITKLQVILEEGKLSQADNYIKVDDEKLNKSTLEPLITYYLSNSNEVEDLIYNLKKSGKSGNFTVKSEKTLLGERYYLNVSKVKVKISPTIKEVDLYLNDKKVEASKWIDVIPGAYDLEYKLKTEYGDVDEKKTIELFTDKEEKVSVAAEYITLYSNFEDAKVFINGKDINKTVSEVKEYGPIPTNKDITLHIEKNFPWGNIKSEKVNLKDENIIKVDLNMANSTLLLDIEDTLNEFYKELFEALNQGDSSLMTNVEESSRKEIFDSIYVKTALFSNNYNISDLQFRIENSEFMMKNGKYQANILVEINYNIAKKLLPFIKEEKEGSFLMGLGYKENTWLVESCQKIKLDLEVE